MATHADLPHLDWSNPRSYEVSLHGQIQQPLEGQNSEDGEREDKDATGE